MPVKLTNALPKSAEVNGLDAIVSDLVQKPAAFHAAVVWLDCIRVTEDVDSGERTPTVRLRRIEVVNSDDEETLRSIAQRAFTDRTGNAELPLDFDDDVSATFEDE